jgi:hypothetical protein
MGDFKFNGAGVGDLLRSEGVQAHLRRKAEGVLAAAKAGAPVVSGHYRDSLYLEEAVTDRAKVRVKSEATYAMAVEADTGNLARALGRA